MVVHVAALNKRERVEFIKFIKLVIIKLVIIKFVIIKFIIVNLLIIRRMDNTINII